MKKILLSLTAVTFLFAACSKDEADTRSRKDLAGGNWKLTLLGFDANSNGVADNGETFPTVDSVYSVLLSIDTAGTGIAYTHWTFGDDTSHFQWNFENNEQAIRIITPIDTVTNDTTLMAIAAFSATQFTLIETDSDTLKTIQTFQKQ